MTWPIRSGVLTLSALLAACAEGPSGQVSPGQTSAGETGAVVTIAAIQGAGERSPLLGQTHQTRGVVSGNFGGLGGFFVASPSGEDDGDPATAEGLFVRWTRDDGPMPKRGDLLALRGRVDELGDAPASLTALVDVEWQVIGKDRVPTHEVSEPPAEPGQWEALEGMRLRLPGPLVVASHYELKTFGALTVAFGELPQQPTDRVAPGPEAARLAADNARRMLILDDGRDRRDPERIWYLADQPNASAPWRIGTTLAGVEGLLDHRHGRYRLQLTDPPADVRQAERPAPPQRQPGVLRVVALNVLNLFNGDGRGGGFPTERGAARHDQYQRQQAKLVEQVRLLDADIVALMEIENDGFGPDSALAQFVAALRAAQPSADWRVVDAGDGPGTDAIRVALIHRADQAEALGAPATLTDGPFATGSRAPLAQTFRTGNGPAFTVVVNHFKSKGGCDRAGPDDRDRGDGQGCFNGQRVAAAHRLATWLDGDPTRSGSDHVLIVGDLNAYRREDPITTLTERGWRPLLDDPDLGSSYVYAGAAGSLDHALASEALAARLGQALVWAANAEENAFFAYQHGANVGENANQASPWGGSDHNPLVLDFRLSEPTDRD